MIKYLTINRRENGDVTQTHIEKKPADDPKGHAQKAYEGIRKMLFHNEIVAGQKIAYRDLAERLNMSQTPVIQALKWLEFQQLVRHEPNRGYYTAPISLQEVREIYELRELIELSLLPRTIEGLDLRKTQRLQAAFNAHAKASREVYLYDRLLKDMQFHLILASLSESIVQQNVLQNLFDLLYLKYGGNFLFSTAMASAAADHKALLDSILARNLKEARRTLSRHIRRVQKHVLSGVERQLQATRFE